MNAHEAIPRIHAICCKAVMEGNPLLAIAGILDITGPMMDDLEFHQEFGRQVLARFSTVDLVPDARKS